MKFISRTTIATIFTEAIDKAVPRKSEVIRRFPGSGNMLSGSISPSPTPQRNGMTMPISEANREARPVLSHKLEVCLHPGEQQQQQNAKLRDRIDHRLLFGVLRKECVLQVRKKKAKKGWAEQQSGNQLTHDGRLAQPQHRFAQQSADHHERDDLCNEDRVGRTLAAFGRPHRRSRKNEQGAQPNAKANHLHFACKPQTPGRRYRTG